MATATKKKAPAPIPVRFGQGDRRLLKMIEAHASAESRSLSGQIKHYALLGLVASENPDLPLSMIEDILVAQAESQAGLGQPYRWGVIEG
jgi:hypothetical protein